MLCGSYKLPTHGAHTTKMKKWRFAPDGLAEMLKTHHVFIRRKLLLIPHTQCFAKSTKGLFGVPKSPLPALENEKVIKWSTPLDAFAGNVP